MTKNLLEYKNYYSYIEIDFEDHVLRGHLEGIGDLVNFESDSIKGIEQEFRAAVDDYIEFCHENNKEPDLPEPKLLRAYS